MFYECSSVICEIMQRKGEQEMSEARESTRSAAAVPATAAEAGAENRWW